MTVRAVAIEHASSEANRVIMSQGVHTVLVQFYIYPAHVRGVQAVQQISL